MVSPERTTTEPCACGRTHLRILRVAGGSLAMDTVADVVIVDPARDWKYDPAKGYSKSVNSPWAGHTLTGRVTHTIVGGQLVYDVERGILT